MSEATELYIPKPGERVRVVAISPDDDMPGCSVGDVVEVSADVSQTVASAVWEGYLNLAWVRADAGPRHWRTICLVEPCRCTCSHHGSDACCEEHGEPTDREERVCESCAGGAHGPQPEVPCERVATCHGQMWLCSECADNARHAERCGLYDLGHPRRFCACGQELMGKRFESALCGDCFGGWQLTDPRSIGEQRRTAPSLDDRIRAAQPEVTEHAWQTPTAEGP